MNTSLRSGRRMAALALALTALPAAALDLQYSGFASLGHAQSNRDFRVQRFIDGRGTWQRDTLIAGQVDATLSHEWSATVQARLAPSLEHDSRWDPTLSWAFVGWRPSNDWLLRAGRLRVPLFLFSETQDVGTTINTVRLPHDLYGLAPTSDFTGLYATRNGSFGVREVSVDAYTGYADTTYRRWFSNGAPPAVPAGASFTPVDVRATGLVLTLREPTLTLRLGLHGVLTRMRQGPGVAQTYARVDLAPGLGYWQVDDALPGPGVVRVGTIRNLFGAVGLDWQPGSGWRITAEAARVRQYDTEVGVDARSGYVSAARSIGSFAPYVTVSRLLSSSRQRDWAVRLRQSTLPSFLPGAAAINASQQLAAQAVTSYDQQSAAIGLNWTVSPASALKIEWMRTHLGSGSSMADRLPGQALQMETNVHVRSIVFSTAF